MKEKNMDNLRQAIDLAKEQKASDFFLSDPKKSRKLLELTGLLFSEGIKDDEKNDNNKKLLIDGFECEQVWEQMNLFCDPITKSLETKINSFDDVDISEDEDEGDKDKNKDKKKKKKKSKKRIVKKKEKEIEIDAKKNDRDVIVEEDVDDEDVDEEEDSDIFYRKKDMKIWAEEVENREENSEALEDEEYEVVAGEEDNPFSGIKYQDFFDPPPSDRDGEDSEISSQEEYIGNIDDEDEDDDEFTKITDTNDDENDENDEKDEKEKDDEDDKKSTYEKELEKINQTIERMEERNLKELHWKTKGEVSIRDRPENSLLGEDLEYEHATTKAPVVTEEFTGSLEDIIKRRIVEESWDDVIPKTLKQLPKSKKKMVELDDKKSKLSLAEIYEQEYLNKQKKELQNKESKKKKNNNDDEEEEEEETKEQKDAKVLFIKISKQLDALSHYNYNPSSRDNSNENVVIPNVKAIKIEEVIPLSVSSADHQFPEEVFKRGRVAPVGKEEITQDDRKRKRASHKRKNKKRKLESDRQLKIKAEIDPKVKETLKKKASMKLLKNSTSVQFVAPDKNHGRRRTKSSHMKNFANVLKK